MHHSLACEHMTVMLRVDERNVQWFTQGKAQPGSVGGLQEGQKRTDTRAISRHKLERLMGLKNMFSKDKNLSLLCFRSERISYRA